MCPFVFSAEVSNRVGNLADEAEQLYKGHMQREMEECNIGLGTQMDIRLSEEEGKLIFQSIFTFLEPLKLYKCMCTWTYM